jgi:uroporphyrinogen-III synthase
MLMTRPDGANAAFARQFPADLSRAVEQVDCPLLRIAPLEQEIAMPADAAAIFTSSNGVRFAPRGLGRRAYCVGTRTSATASAAGWRAVCAGQTAKALVTHVVRERPTAPLWHLCGRHVRGDVAEKLSAQGFNVTRLALYDQILLPLSGRAKLLLSSKSPLLVPLFSPRTAAHFSQQAKAYPGLKVAALSASVAEALPDDAGFDVLVASEPTAARLINSIEKLVETIRLG